MPGDTIRTPISTWNRDVFRATVLAYRQAMIEGRLDPVAAARACDAYVAAGGDPARASAEVMSHVAAAIRDHGAWFWRPVHERIAREEAALKKLGWWPPPTAWDKHRAAAEEAVRRVFGDGTSAPSSDKETD